MMKHVLLGIICIAVLCIILTLGLWPFHAPRNEVTWLTDRDGVRFGDNGTVMGSTALAPADAPNATSCSIEIWLQPAQADAGGTILAFYNAPRRLLSVHQSIDDLMLQQGTGRLAKTYVDHLFRTARAQFVTITSGARATSVYLNGILAKTALSFRIASSDCTGRLILGDAPLQQDAWAGEIRGLAIYQSELAAPNVLRHYYTWTHNGKPDLSGNERIIGLYLFNERTGSVVHNHAGTGFDLAIPGTYTVLDKVMLEPFWSEFNNSWGYWKNAFKNIIGFVPLGFCFFAYVSRLRIRRFATPITVLLGTAASLTIEVLQGYLPTRDSGTTDLITNTLGTYIGVLAYFWTERRLRAWLAYDAARADDTCVGK